MPRGSQSKSNGSSSRTSNNNKGSSSNNNANANANSGATRSNNSYYKAYGGWPNFMHSHGLKPWDLDDVEEGRAILEAMKAYDREEGEN
ncbi:hypothetical protein AGABI1DRAFT_113057 [Agaricus bisporus var. burnettii JB137-S8]|uniref:Uncharacterized protein n=1 Tax=Agaricus bisporus var. burnettii (strain JB137-S8 / ATCC MYA-4627 / FGSC 10392) TaxID=597362 RepID=K5X9P3_AGABU|nr:uncharacterized protein AGABI1DRAFT_113057 [Agaricus bisporus var. burnettii JB137-S8]EKM79752.1 hypothetical protein AGABI1DRAFT_113057 [Agaricus bisporus var. burnettii JB137-S8]